MDTIEGTELTLAEAGGQIPAVLEANRAEREPAKEPTTADSLQSDATGNNNGGVPALARSDAGTRENARAGRLLSLFAGAGGMDLGFEQAGFEIAWANEFDKAIWQTYLRNHPKTPNFCGLSIIDVKPIDLPRECDGVIGGPPCQSWSVAGARRGGEDPRGRLFEQYIRVLDEVNPKFFVAENVAGMLTKTHRDSFEAIKARLAGAGAGYSLFAELVNAGDYGVPQDRERILFIGYRKDLGKQFRLPPRDAKHVTLLDTIKKMEPAIAALEGNRANKRRNLTLPNHEYYIGTYSSHYMSRNRVKDWNARSFTIMAGGRYAPQHPDCKPMIKLKKDVCEFADGIERRLSVRECARIQTFSDNFVFYYDNVDDGYKMAGNAVPVKLAHTVARQIRSDLAS